MSDVEIIGTPERTVTRRKFIMGVIAAGATTSSVGYLFKGPQPLLGALLVQGSVERLVTLNVNGQQRRVDVMKQETLAFTLRYKLGLTGTKLGCDRAECGACTVLIDGVNSYSCSVLTHTVRGAQITTIEGLPLRVPRAFDVAGALQCGFCQPGMMLSARALLDRTPLPDREAIRAALAGNLCRCTGYTQILEAVELVAHEAAGLEAPAPCWMKDGERAGRTSR